MNKCIVKYLIDMSLVRRLFLIINFLFAFHFGFSQDLQYVFQQISTERGLPGASVRYICQDKTGIIWLSIESMGLCRFNGRNFELFSYNPNDKSSLSNNFISCILEDTDSNLWIATEKGLNKFSKNNRKFIKYIADSTKRSGFTDNLILSLLIDSKKNLWAGTGNGLFKYNKGLDKFELIPLKSKESPLWINSIFEHSSGDFFLGTNDGVILYNPGSGYQLHFPPGNTAVNGPMTRMVSTILEDYQGNLWFGTYRGINKYYYKTGKFEIYNFQPYDAGVFGLEGFLNSFTNDHKRLWFSSFTKGIVIINAENGTYQKLKMDENSEGTLKSNYVRHIYQDRAGLLWMATKFAGLHIYDSKKDMFKRLPAKYKIFQSARNEDIRAVYNDTKKGLFWIGTMNNGLIKIDLIKNTIQKYTHDINNVNSLGSNRVHRIYRDRDGALWIGQWTGLDLFDEQNGRFIHFGNNVVDCIIEDVKHNIWVGTGDGIYIANKSKRKIERFAGNKNPFFTSNSIPIMFAHHDKNGWLWFATRSNGFYGYNPVTNDFRQYTTNNTRQKLRTNAIRAISEDDSGNLFFGTKGEGLCIFNPQKENFSYLTSSDGLASDFVLCIQRDLTGNFWIGGHNGISQYDTKQKKFTNYSTGHGLHGNIFENGNNDMLNDGYLVFSGNAGLNVFHPDLLNLQSKNINDSIIISTVKTFDRELVHDIFQNTTLELTHKQDYITIEFVLSDFLVPLKHTFYYRIAEINENWFNLGNKNFVALSGLKPGTYHFEVKGTNEFGLTCKKPITLTLIIKPPFYQTWWFRGAVIILIILIIFLIIRYRINLEKKTRQYLEREISNRTEALQEANAELIAQNHFIENQKLEIEKNQELLEVKVRERTKDLELAKIKAEESDKLKSAFLANMSHEIRTPLNAILGFSSLIADSVEGDSEFATYTKHISTSGEMLLHLINDILDISKIEAGLLEISKTKVHLASLLDTVYKTFYQQITDKHGNNVKLQVKGIYKEGEELFIYTDIVRLKQIIFNLMSNAIKFTNNGSVEFGYNKENGLIKFYVKDTGIGIKDTNLELIFNRFIKLENKDALYRGNGLGLYLSRSIVQLLGGKIWVESIENKGSTFYFTLPCSDY